MVRALLGVCAGVALGATAGPLGVAFGIALGLAIGVIAGKVIEKDERIRAHRTRELDAVIGITEGSLGAGPVSLVPPSDAPLDGDSWLAEWLTPPPPMVSSK
jgi:transketolase N-terminal domain/subunit